MLPRLQAEERLSAITDRMVAFGTADKDMRKETFAKLENCAGFKRTKPKKANGLALAGMGIGVRGPSPPAQEVLSDG